MLLNFEAVSEAQSIDFFLKYYNFTLELIDEFRKQYREELSKEIRIDFYFKFKLDKVVFQRLLDNSIRNINNRGFKKHYKGYINTEKAFSFNDMEEYLGYILLKESSDNTLYFDKNKINLIFEKFFNTSFENPKDSIEKFSKKFLNDLNIEIFDYNVFYDINLSLSPEPLNLYDLPILKIEDLYPIRKQIEFNAKKYKNDFQLIFIAIKEIMDIDLIIDKFSKQLTSHIENMDILINNEKNQDKKFEYINFLRQDLLKIRKIYTEKNRKENGITLNGERTIRNQFDRFLLYLENHQETLFDDLVPQSEIDKILNTVYNFKRHIEDINNKVIETINILDSKEKRLKDLTAWDKIYEEYKITEIDTPAAREMKLNNFQSHLSFLEDEKMRRIVFRSGSNDYTDIDLSEHKRIINTLLSYKYISTPEKTTEEIEAFEMAEIKKAEMLEKKERFIEKVRQELSNKLQGLSLPSIFDDEREMNIDTFEDMIFDPRNSIEINFMISNIIKLYENEIKEFDIDVRDVLITEYRNHFKFFEKKRLIEAKDRREKWNETIV